MQYERTMKQYRQQIQLTDLKIKALEAMSIKAKPHSPNQYALASRAVPQEVVVFYPRNMLPVVHEHRTMTEPTHSQSAAYYAQHRTLTESIIQPGVHAVASSPLVNRQEAVPRNLLTESLRNQPTVADSKSLDYSNVKRYQDYLRQYQLARKSKIGQKGYQSEHSKVLQWIMYKQNHEEKERQQTLLRFQAEAEKRKKDKSVTLRKQYEAKLLMPIHGWQDRASVNMGSRITTNPEHKMSLSPAREQSLAQSQVQTLLSESGVQTTLEDMPIKTRQKRNRSEMRQPQEKTPYINRHLFSLRRKKQPGQLPSTHFKPLPRKDPLNEVSDLLSEVKADLQYDRELRHISNKLYHLKQQINDERRMNRDALTKKR